MNIGDTIICSSEDNMIDTMIELAQAGIETDFVYGEEDKYKLVVTDIEEGKNNEKRISRTMHILWSANINQTGWCWLYQDKTQNNYFIP